MSNFIPAVIRKQENVIENVIVLYHEIQKNTTDCNITGICNFSLILRCVVVDVLHLLFLWFYSFILLLQVKAVKANLQIHLWSIL